MVLCVLKIIHRRKISVKGILRGNACAMVQEKLHEATGFAKSKEVQFPPNPKELLITQLTGVCKDVVTGDWVICSPVCVKVVSPIKVFSFSIRMENTASIAPAAPNV